MYSFKLKAEKSNSKLSGLKSSKEIYKDALSTEIEDCYNPDDLIYEISTHALVGAVQTCFAYHLPLRLSPDSIWVTITKGLADHINKNAEELRSKFVNFDGKTEIEIYRDFFFKGKPNDWAGCFDEFSEKIKGYIGEDNHNRIVSNFSTTDRIRLAVSEVVLMDAMQSYFTYIVHTLCGIPEIILEGTVDDWKSIKERFSGFREYGMDWWVDALSPVLDEFISASEGNPNLAFWEELYSEGGGSGGPYISGHIIKFYPYIEKNLEKNLFEKRSGFSRGFSSDSFTIGLSKVPFIWNYFGHPYKMEFIAGMIGIKQADDGSISPEFSWAVREASTPLLSLNHEDYSVGMEIFDKYGNKGILENAQFDHSSYGGKEHTSMDWCLIKWNGKSKKHDRWQIDGLWTKAGSK